MPIHSHRERWNDSIPSSSESADHDESATPSATNTMKAQDSPLFQPPSEEEADMFYYGLPSQPRLLGRTSSCIDAWEGWDIQHSKWLEDQCRSAWFSMRKRTLGSIGDHRIRRCWADQVQPAIMAAIGHLPWSSVDVFRIGYTEMPLLERPVVVWIGVESKSIPWEDVNKALQSCRRILDAAKLEDVDCQVRVSNIVSLVTPGPPLLSPQVERSELAKPFTTSIGQSFFPFLSPGLMGSLGIYLRPAAPDGNDNDDAKERGTQQGTQPLWAITCRHVGLPNQPNAYYRRQEPRSSPEYEMGIPGEDVVQLSLKALALKTDSLAKSSAETEQRQDKLKNTNALYDTIEAFEPLEARKTGVVILAPPIELGLHPVPWTRDWCLVKLYDEKFTEGNAMANIVDIDVSDLVRVTLHELLNRSRKPGEPALHLPASGLLHIQSLLPLSEIHNPPGPTINIEGDECIIVGKHGAKTGLTWGSPSELQSTVRNCVGDGSASFVSQEWAIHGSFENMTVPFSAPGDSGAAVFCFNGRLGGFVTRGAGQVKDGKVDITYATPAALVLADIEKELGEKVVVL